MSGAYKCDRCGNLYEINDTKHNILFDGKYLEVISVGNHNNYSFKSPFDICNNCASEFVNWWTLPTTKKEETV